MSIKLLRITHLDSVFDITAFDINGQIAYSTPVVVVSTTPLRSSVVGSAVLHLENGDMYINNQQTLWINAGMEEGWVVMRYSLPGVYELVCVPLAVIEFIIHVGENNLSNVTARVLNREHKFLSPLDAPVLSPV